ncbi:MAG: hypothetical protein IH630_07125 [Thermoplasmata archaeon]|nr:hypothetical protein [Thermoplasmata archaeon]
MTVFTQTGSFRAEPIAVVFRGYFAETTEELGVREFARLPAPQGMEKLKKDSLLGGT